MIYSYFTTQQSHSHPLCDCKYDIPTYARRCAEWLADIAKSWPSLWVLAIQSITVSEAAHSHGRWCCYWSRQSSPALSLWATFTSLFLSWLSSAPTKPMRTASLETGQQVEIAPGKWRVKRACLQLHGLLHRDQDKTTWCTMSRGR